MKSCNITSKSLIIAQLFESNKLQPIFKVCNISYLSVLFESSWLLLTFWYASTDLYNIIKEIFGKEILLFLFAIFEKSEG